MALTINLVLLKRRKRNDGTIPIYIRFTEDRTSRYRSTGEAIKKKYWQYDKDADNPIHSSYRHSKKMNLKLRRRLREIKDTRDDLEIAGTLSMDTLLNEISEDTDPRSIIHQAKLYRDHLQLEDRYWEQRHFKVVIGNLESFIEKKEKSDRLDQLDSQWIEDLQDFLLTEVTTDKDGNPQGNSNNTVRKKIQRVKGFTDWLYKNDEIEGDPFSRVDRVKAKPTNSKVKLTFEQIGAIKDLDLKTGSRMWHVRNYFLYSFYNAGIRFGDLCTLRWDNIIDGRLVYEMHKTGGKKSIRQLEPMQEILEFYRSGNSTPYIFPLLDKTYTDPMELRKRISSLNVQVNNRLKTLADKAGIQANISFHVSRHSFAHYALKKGMDLYSISKALGHADLQVTQAYIKSFDEQLLDDKMNKLF
ncbi:MAG: tyrosine-type recombinase/integrase [Bacteroidetes bacterium]|jgi:site-specific recombinase XerD|nr:tyrosine-type recombinase/integrase [Bacteroidota bacterium]